MNSEKVSRKEVLPGFIAIITLAVIVYIAMAVSYTHLDVYKRQIFNVYVPTECPGVPSDILNPSNTWEDKEAYTKSAKELSKKFNENFKKMCIRDRTYTICNFKKNFIDFGRLL